MRALITGITGFAGQHLTEHLLRCGDQVFGSTYRDPWHVSVGPATRDQVALFEWNLAQPLADASRERMRQFAPECIYHLAAISVPSQCGTSEPSALAQAVNVHGTQAVIDLARSLDVPPRVLVISSAHVYAPVSPEQPVVNEDARLGPAGAYGKTKLQAEAVCRRAVEQGADVVVVRAFQHSGPRQLPMFMLPEWAQQFAAADEGPVGVVTLDSHVDLSDVRDVVRAYRLLVQCAQPQSVYNVGSGRSVRSGDVFQQLEQLAGARATAVESRPGIRQHPIADISRLIADTQWQAEISLEQTIADTLDDFRQQAGRGSL